MSPDPISFAGGLNLYSYAENDPVNMVDPEGLQGIPPQVTNLIQQALQHAGTSPAGQWVTQQAGRMSGAVSQGVSRFGHGAGRLAQSGLQRSRAFVQSAQRGAQRAFARIRSVCQRGSNGGTRAEPDIDGLSEKIIKQSQQRGWTPETIKEAFRSGKRFPAVNRLRGANTPATRYVHPKTGASVVIDNATGQVIQVGRPDFLH